MNGIPRRSALLGACSLGALALAGCLGDSSAADSPGSDEPNDDVSSDVFQLGPSAVRSAWAEGERDDPGFVALFESAADASGVADADVDGLEAWLEETDFDESVVVFLETVGPNTCYDELAVSAVDVVAIDGPDGDEVTAVTGTAEAADTSDGTAACGEALTYPAALVRVTAADRPEAAAFEITNGWGETGEVSTVDGGNVPSVDADSLPGFVRPSGDPRTVPSALDCDNPDFERHWSHDETVRWGEISGEDGEPALALRVHNPQYDGDDEDRALAFDRGDVVAVSMENVGDEPLSTGNRNKYALEVLTDEGWTDIRGTADGAPVEYTDEAIGHEPGEGFEWAFELTRDGVVADHAQSDRLEVCPGLPAGRYRFAFWGAIGDEAPAVAFDLVE